MTAEQFLPTKTDLIVYYRIWSILDYKFSIGPPLNHSNMISYQSINNLYLHVLSCIMSKEPMDRFPSNFNGGTHLSGSMDFYRESSVPGKAGFP